MNRDIAKKIDRIMQGRKPSVLDLFSGAGGLTLGFKTAGFSLIGGVDTDPVAAQTYTENFFSELPHDLKRVHSLPVDIVNLDPNELLSDYGYDLQENPVDVVIGGPPCQAFARIGRAKLREISRHPEAYLQDPRANLYLRFIDYIKVLSPLAILMENVPDSLNYKGHNIAQETCELLSDMGYECRYTILNSAHYGVPQLRDRMILIALRKELGQKVGFPQPDHRYALPSGYHTGRDFALYNVNNHKNPMPGFFDREFYIRPPVSSPDYPLTPCTRDALGDLPRIHTMELQKNSLLPTGKRNLRLVVPYSNSDNYSRYAYLMRNWRGFESRNGVTANVIRNLPRDFRIFNRMKPGDYYPEALEIAERLFFEELVTLIDSDHIIRNNSKEYLDLRKKFIPPYDPSKFPDKWRKLDPDQPSHTILAHLSKDCYSHIHYDSAQARTITVREAARLQSFPDGFVFNGGMNSSFRHIGNAVPPLLSYHLASEIMKALGHDPDPVLSEE